MKLITKANDKKGILTKVLSEVKHPKKQLKTLEKMEKIMLENNGVGLAASQVGLNKRMFVFRLNDGTFEYAINPVIHKKSNYTSIRNEGCLSYPDKFVPVKRPVYMVVEYHNGIEVVKRKLRKFECIVFSHEYEHLDGKCIVGLEEE